MVEGMKEVPYWGYEVQRQHWHHRLGNLILVQPFAQVSKHASLAAQSTACMVEHACMRFGDSGNVSCRVDADDDGVTRLHDLTLPPPICVHHHTLIHVTLLCSCWVVSL